jgi:hypothetical protein
MLGNTSGLVIGLEPMSMCCISCEKNIPHHPNICSHNNNSSSKGIEVTGAVTLVVKLSSDDTVYVGDFVSDDDASSRASISSKI